MRRGFACRWIPAGTFVAVAQSAGDLEVIGVDRPAHRPMDAGAAAIAGTILGTISLLFLARSQFVIGAYGLRGGGYDPRDPLTITAVGQMVLALVAVTLSRYGQRTAHAQWHESVAGAGVVVSVVASLISAAALVFIVTR